MRAVKCRWKLNIQSSIRDTTNERLTMISRCWGRSWWCGMKIQIFSLNFYVFLSDFHVRCRDRITSATLVCPRSIKCYQVNLHGNFLIYLFKLNWCINRVYGWFSLHSTVIGWGKRNYTDESGTSRLREAEIPIIPNKACKQVYHDYVITKNMFCAGSKGIDTCAVNMFYFTFEKLHSI